MPESGLGVKEAKRFRIAGHFWMIPMTPSCSVHITPLPSRATRGHKRSRRSSPAKLFTYGSAFALHNDSALECEVAAVTRMDPNVREVVDQPPAVEYVDLEKNKCTHTFDFLVIYKDGSRKFFFCKYLSEVVEKRWDIFVDLLAEQIDPAVADAICIKTEFSLSKVEVDTAQLFREALRHGPSALSRQILDYMRRNPASVSAGELANIHGGWAECFWPIMRLLAKGFLIHDPSTAIGPMTIIEAPAAVLEAA